MSNVERQKQWDHREAAEFERLAAEHHKRVVRSAAWTGAALLVDILCIIPFAEGNFLHAYQNPMGEILAWIAIGLGLLLLLKVGFVWSSWLSAEETRRVHGLMN
jgi:hypothetical protein